MVVMASRFINELGSVKMVVFESRLYVVMSLLEDVIPFYHVSAGVCTVSYGMGWWDCPKCIMTPGNGHFFCAVAIS